MSINKKVALISLVTLVLMSLVLLIFQMPLMYKESAEENEVTYLIGMSHPNLTDEWQIVAHDEMLQRAAQYSDVKLIFTDANSSSYKQIKDVAQLMDYGIDLLIITVNDANVLGDTINKINEKIPVIVLNKDAQFYNYTLYIGPDYEKIGDLAGKQLNKLFGSKSANIISLSGPIEEESVGEMNSGMSSYFKKHPTLSLESTLYSNWLKSQAEKDIRKLLNSKSKVDAIVAQSYAMAIGASNALSDVSKEVYCIGVSEILTNNHLSAIQTGKLNSIIYTPVGGKEAIDYGLKILKKNGELPKKIILKSTLVTQDNLNEYIKLIKEEELSKSTPVNSEKQRLKVGYIKTGLWEDEKIMDFTHVLSDQLDLTLIYKELPIDQSKEVLDSFQKDTFINLLDEQVDMIVMNPVSNQGWEDYLLLAENANIWVVLLGNELNTDRDNITYIGPSYMEQGKLIASNIVNELYNSQFTIGIMEVTGDSDLLATQYRKQGFRLIANGYSRIKIIDSFVASDVQEILTYQIENSFRKHPNSIDIIYATDETYYPSIVSALKRLNLSADKDVKILLNNSKFIELRNKDISVQVLPSQLYEDQLKDLFVTYANGGKRVDKIILPEHIVNN